MVIIFFFFFFILKIYALNIFINIYKYLNIYNKIYNNNNNNNIIIIRTYLKN